MRAGVMNCCIVEGGGVVWDRKRGYLLATTVEATVPDQATVTPYTLCFLSIFGPVTL